MTPPSDQRPDRRSTAAIAACFIAIVALTGMDMATKSWALDTLSIQRVGELPPLCKPNDLGNVVYQRMPGKVVQVIPGYFELHYAENCGAAFGLMRGARPWVRHLVFGVAAVLASIALLWMFVRNRGGPLFAWSVPFIVAGALGNLIDRLRLGYVLDFIRWHIHDRFDWPTFNFADAAITVGVILLVLDGAFEGKRARAQKAVAAGSEQDVESRSS